MYLSRSVGLNRFEGSHVYNSVYAIVLTACGYYTLYQSYQCLGCSDITLLCEAQGLRRTLGLVKRWTGSSEVWLCNGEHHMAVVAVREVMH